MPPSPRPAFLQTHLCPRTLGQARAPNAVWSSSSSSQFSHPISAVPQPPILASLILTHSHSHTRMCVHAHGPIGRRQLTLRARQVSRAGTIFQRSEQQASRKWSGSGLGGGAGKKKSVVKDKKKMRSLVSNTLQHKETGRRPPSGLHYTGRWAGAGVVPLHGVEGYGPGTGQRTLWLCQGQA